MTEDEIYSVSLVRFADILGLKDHTRYPKKLHDDRVIKFNWMHFIYEKMSTNCSKLNDLNGFLCAASAFAEDFISKGG
jgi:hypothetical protein